MMKTDRMKSVFKYALFYAGICFLFIMPDIVYGIIDRNFTFSLFRFEKFLISLVFPLSLALMRSLKAVACVLIFFGILHLVQLSSMAYFGNFLSPFTLILMFVEFEDVARESLSLFFRYIYLLFIIAVPYGLFFLALKIADRWRPKVGYAWLGMVLLCGVLIARMYVKLQEDNMLFKNTQYATFNTINTYSALFGHVFIKEIRKAPLETNYIPYEVKKTGAAVEPEVNIVVIFGESVNSNHMSLLGYERPTTPLLEKRAQNNENFVAMNSFSIAVSTLIATPMFLNIQREPMNFIKQTKKDTYLPKLAQENGFRTYYIGMQGVSVYEKSFLSFFDDRFISSIGSQAKDGGSPELAIFKWGMENIPLRGRNFIFIHKRNLHAPFEENYAFDREKYEVYPTKGVDNATYRHNSYDNAMMYEDFLINEMMEYFKNNSQAPTYIYYVSDHGEAVAGGKSWGHVHLQLETVQVPFVFEAMRSADRDYVKKIKALYQPSAYEIGLLIADRLGYEITNPNEDGTYFVNGPSTVGDAGYLVIRKDGKSGTVSVEKIE